jgi:hypothetical protein
VIFNKACPRCSGAIVDYEAPLLDGPMCLNCGWRQTSAIQTLPPERREASSATVATKPASLTVRRAAI